MAVEVKYVVIREGEEKTGKLPSPQVVGAESEEEDASHAA